MQYANENITDYLVRFCNVKKVNEACDGRLSTRGLQCHGMNVIFPLHTTGFYLLQENENKESETLGDEILYEILYHKNPDKYRFSDLKERVENIYMC